MPSQVTIVDDKRVAAARPGMLGRIDLTDITSRSRQRGNWWRLPLFVICTVLPTLAMMFYALTVTSPTYTSEVSFAVRSRDGQGSVTGLGAIAGQLGVGLASSNDIFAVRSHLESTNLFEKIDGETKFSQAAAQPGRDWWVRLPTDATAEQKFRYFRSMVSVRLSTVEQIITISGSGFSPAQARNLTSSLVVQAEAFVNRMSEKAKFDFVALADAELKKAEGRVARTRIEITKWRNVHLQLDPQKAVEAQLQIVSGLTSELAKLRAEISQLEASLTDVQARLRQSRLREQALARQIDLERDKIAGENSEMALRISEYERLIIERDLAEKAYATAVESLKAAQQEANQKQKYVVVTAEPSTPQEPSFPRPLYHPALVAVSGICVYLLVSLLFSLLREYRHES